MLAYIFLLIITICIVILVGIYLFKKDYGIMSKPTTSSSSTTTTIPTTTTTTCKPKITTQQSSLPKITSQSIPKNNITPIIEKETPEWFNTSLYVKTRTIQVPLNIHYILDIDYKLNGNNYNTYVNLTNMNTIINSLNETFLPLHIQFFINKTIKESASINVGKYFWDKGNISNTCIQTHLNMILDFFINSNNQSFFNCSNNNKYRVIAKFLLYTLINDKKIDSGINIYLIPFLWRDMFSVISNIKQPIIFLPEYNYNYNNNISTTFLKDNSILVKTLSLNIGKMFDMTSEEFINMRDLSLQRIQHIRYIVSNTLKPLDEINSSVLVMTDKTTQYSDYMNINREVIFRLVYNGDIYIKDKLEENLRLINAYITNYFNTAFLREEIIEERISEECKPAQTYYDTLDYSFY
jgi:hypothetical protein